jgi:hypothetical protein
VVQRTTRAAPVSLVIQLYVASEARHDSAQFVGLAYTCLGDSKNQLRGTSLLTVSPRCKTENEYKENLSTIGTRRSAKAQSQTKIFYASKFVLTTEMIHDVVEANDTILFHL